jgi:indolepyruvate ferredoxin oxidoreductase beta subunit
LNRKRRILIAGVGGQGVLSAGRWLGDAAASCGLSMVVAQIRGLSQRGGSVQCSVAVGGLRAPEIPDRMADVLIALEPMEGARAVSKVSKRTSAFVNTRPLLPCSLQTAGLPYPPLSSVLDPIEEAAGSMVAVDASKLAEEAGSPRSLNVVMLGMLAASELLPFPGDRLLHVILEAGIPAFAEVNRSAFRLAHEAVKEARAR